jgi:hypothetical protein
VKRTAYIYKAARSYRTQLEITNDALQRLQEILDELVALTNWNKV